MGDRLSALNIDAVARKLGLTKMAIEPSGMRFADRGRSVNTHQTVLTVSMEGMTRTFEIAVVKGASQITTTRTLFLPLSQI